MEVHPHRLQRVGHRAAGDHRPLRHRHPPARRCLRPALRALLPACPRPVARGRGAGVRALGGGIRHQGRLRAHAHLAARRPQRGAGAGLGDAVGLAAVSGASTRSCASSRSRSPAGNGRSPSTCSSSSARSRWSPAALFVVRQRNYKRLLAYSSIEHMGIIALGIGFGAPLAVAGALLHVLTHAAAKGLAFFGAGSLLRGYDTKEVDGITDAVRAMPWTGPCSSPPRWRCAACRSRACSAASFEIVAGGFARPQYVGVTLLLVGVNLAFFGVIWHAARMVLSRPATRRRWGRGAPVVGERSAWMVAGMVGLSVRVGRARRPPSRAARLPADQRGASAGGAGMTSVSRRPGELPGDLPQHLGAVGEPGPPHEVRLRVKLLASVAPRTCSRPPARASSRCLSPTLPSRRSSACSRCTGRWWSCARPLTVPIPSPTGRWVSSGRRRGGPSGNWPSAMACTRWVRRRPGL